MFDTVHCGLHTLLHNKNKRIIIIQIRKVQTCCFYLVVPRETVKMEKENVEPPQPTRKGVCRFQEGRMTIQTRIGIFIADISSTEYFETVTNRP